MKRINMHVLPKFTVCSAGFGDCESLGLAFQFLFFFFNPQRKKRQRGEGVKKKGRCKRKFSYLRKFQLTMLWKIAGEKIRLFNTLQERLSLWDVCVLSLACDSFYTLMIVAAVLSENIPFCRTCNTRYLLDNVRILLCLLSVTSKHFISTEVSQRALTNVNCYYAHFPKAKLRLGGHNWTGAVMRSLKFLLPLLQFNRETTCRVTVLAGAQVARGVGGTVGSCSVKPILLQVAASISWRPQVLTWLRL